METREITIEGITFKVAPTPLAKLAKTQAVFGANAMESPEGVEAMVEALFWGIRRARKECEASGGITLEWLLENIDSRNAKDVFELFRDVNTLVAPGAGQGEAPASAS